jgi:hypothetical protein
MSASISPRVMPFSVPSENRTEPFTPELEGAAVFALAELDRDKGSGLLAKQPEETVAFIAKIGYPLWVCPWSEGALIFDGLNLVNFSLPHIAVPDVNDFLDSLKRSARTQETYEAFLSDNMNYFEACAVEKSLLVNGLMTDPQFLAEFEVYHREAIRANVANSRMGFLAPRIDESTIASKIRELENLRFSLQESVDSQRRAVELLDSYTRQSLREIREDKRAVKEEFDSKIRTVEEAVAPRIAQIKGEYDFQTTSMMKVFEKQRLLIQHEKTKLEKSRKQAQTRIEHYKREAKAHADKGHSAAERSWKEKAGKTKKELSEIEKQLTKTEKALKDLEEKRALDTFKLKEELEVRVNEARKGILELEASRDAKILIYDQESEKLETETRTLCEQIGKTAKLQEANMAQLGKLGFKKEPGQQRGLLCYVPFYVVCYQKESKKRYLILPPSVVNAVGVFTKLKSVLGIAKLRSLLVPRFKTVVPLGDSIQALMQRNVVFEAKVRELGAKNNLLAGDDTRAQIKKGLARLNGERWLSDREFEAMEQRIG